MLLAKPTKHGAGILLYGDYRDLESVYETIHYLSDGVPLETNFKDLVLGLAYDVRKAMEDRRETIIVESESGEKLEYKGENILWPTFLLQLGLLRWSAGFHPTSREVQANLFRLEACTEKALLEYDYATGRKALKWLERFSGFSDNYIIEFVTIVNRDYIIYSKNGLKRFKNLPTIILSMDPLSSEYQDFEMQIKEKGLEIPYDYKELRVEIDFPDFEW